MKLKQRLARIDKIQKKLNPPGEQEIFVLYADKESDPEQIQKRKEIKDLERRGLNPHVIEITYHHVDGSKE
jgi:hypothetical protein